MADASSTAPDDSNHVQTVTVAPDCFVKLEVKAGSRFDPMGTTVTLRAEGGTAIGVPTVAVDQLRAAGLVL